MTQARVASAASVPQGQSRPSGTGVPAAVSGRCRTHGKAILLGEHAVLHGAPAIAVPVPALHVLSEVASAEADFISSSLHTGPLDRAPRWLAPTVTALHTARERLAPGRPHPLHLRITSNIPAKRGVGSSAAVGASVVGAVADAFGVTLDAQLRHELIQASERAAHGTPSGLDARTVVADEPVWFHRGEVSPLELGAACIVVIADTGIPSGTRSAVTAVRQQREQRPRRVRAIVQQLDRLAVDARSRLAEGDLSGFGDDLDLAHGLLSELAVSSTELDALVAAARRAGALGAKLTGGGRGGCIVALARDEQHAAELAAELRAAGASETWLSVAAATR